MILINSQGYNIADVEILTKLIAGESTAIGTKKDYESLRSFAETGSMQVKCTLAYGGNDMVFDGSVDCNLFETGIEFYTTIYPGPTVTGGDPILVGGQLFMDGNDMKCHINVTPVSGGSSGLESRVEAIEDVIPSDATEENKLATMSDIPSGGGEVIFDYTGDGTKTISEVLDMAHAAIVEGNVDLSNGATLQTLLVVSELYYLPSTVNGDYRFSCSESTNNGTGMYKFVIKSSNSTADSHYVAVESGTAEYSTTDMHDITVGSGKKVKLYKH